MRHFLPIFAPSAPLNRYVFVPYYTKKAWHVPPLVHRIITLQVPSEKKCSWCLFSGSLFFLEEMSFFPPTFLFLDLNSQRKSSLSPPPPPPLLLSSPLSTYSHPPPPPSHFPAKSHFFLLLPLPPFSLPFGHLKIRASSAVSFSWENKCSMRAKRRGGRGKGGGGGQGRISFSLPQA